MYEHVRRLNAEAVDTLQMEDFSVRLLLRRLFQLFQTCILDLLDLLVNEAQMRHLALQLGQCVERNWTPLRGTQCWKLFRCFAQFRVEAADAEAYQCGFHSVGNTSALANQLLALAGGTFCILRFQGGDRGHGAVFLLTAQPTEQRPFEQLNIQPIGLRSPPLPGDRDAGRMNNVGLNPSDAQPARPPKPVTTSFKRDDHAGDLVAGCNRFITPAMTQREQSFLVGYQLLQRLALDTRNHSTHQPMR